MMLVSVNNAAAFLSVVAAASAAPSLEQRWGISWGWGSSSSGSSNSISWSFGWPLFNLHPPTVTRSIWTGFRWHCDGLDFGYDKPAALTHSCRAQNKQCLRESRGKGLCDNQCSDQLDNCIGSGEAKPKPSGPQPASSSNYGSLPANWKSASDNLIAEPENSRALTGWVQSGMQWNDQNTPAQCIAFCQSGGWPIAGVEYGSECFCGASLQNGATLNQYTFNPVMPCSGDASLNCGAHSGLNLFYDASVLSKTDTTFKPVVNPTIQNNGFKPANVCLKETGDGASRLFNGASFTDDNMTSQKCTDFCKSKGADQAGIQAGLEYGTQCYCSSSPIDLAAAEKSDACTLTCPGRRIETCGGQDALTVYTTI